MNGVEGLPTPYLLSMKTSKKFEKSEGILIFQQKAGLYHIFTVTDGLVNILL